LTVKQSAALAACVLRATTKKRSTFLAENLGYAYAPSALSFCAPDVKS